MKKITIVGLAAAVIAAAFLTNSLMRAPEKTDARAPASSDLFPFLRSLDGTRPDGNLQIAEGEALVINAELVRLFDYYLSGVGEKPVDAIRREIERVLDERLKPRAASEAKDVLSRYLAYKQALVEVEKNPAATGNGIDAMRARLLAMQQTRARFFSAAESEAMFGMEDAQNLDAVARLEISQDQSLSPAQKAEKLAALDAALPPALRDARDAPLQVVRLEESVSKLRSQGASDDDVYRVRAAALSPEAASRLADVDREDAQWKARINSYLAERNRLLASSAQQRSEDREAALQQLRQARFAEEEQRRLPAYER
jgi:lipase chaperone LimK